MVILPVSYTHLDVYKRQQLGIGIAGEMERYCLEDEEETRATERAKMKDPQVKIDVLYNCLLYTSRCV